jgi:glycosyltransferase involved in cell wall biosynthesis
MKPLTFGVNALYLLPGAVGGTEIYLRSLVEALDALDTPHRFLVYTNVETGPLGRHPRPLPMRAASRPARLLYEQFSFPRVLRRDGIDALLNAGFTAPFFPARPQVTVFHDLQHKRHPEFFRWFDRPAWNFFLWAAARRSTRLIAVSDATRADLLRCYPFLDPAAVDTIPHGIEPAFFDLARRRAPADFLLCASTTHPHKNHSRLLRAFARLRLSFPDLRLVLTGVRGFAHGDVARLIHELHLDQAVDLKGWLPRADLYELFRTARAFVYPSTFEGFGMPVLEALAAGLPTACSDIEPLRSLAPGVVLLFDPREDDSVFDALVRLLAAPPPATHSVAAYTWHRAATLTLESLLRALS